MDHNKLGEYKSLKTTLASKKKADPNLNGRKVITLIQDSCEKAMDKLDPTSNYWVKVEADRLTDSMKGLGERGALELLAAISFVLPGDPR